MKSHFDHGMGRAKITKDAPLYVLNTYNGECDIPMCAPRVVQIVAEIEDPERGPIVIFQDCTDGAQHALIGKGKGIRNTFQRITEVDP